MGKNSVFRKDAFIILDKIREVCKQTEEGAVYDEGWSDQAILEHFSASMKLTIYNIQGIRRDAVGPLAPPAKPIPPDPALLLARIDLLERLLRDNMQLVNVNLTVLAAKVQDLEEWAAKRPMASFVPRPIEVIDGAKGPRVAERVEKAS